MILLIDNYDSFTYNLYQYLGEIDDVKVVRNDQITLEDIRELRPSLIVISPGPGHPDNAGICIEMIQKIGSMTPILGVCLGHQAIGTAFGATVEKTPNVMHGKVSRIAHQAPELFGQRNEVEVMRYHSLIVNRSTLPQELEEIATSTDDNVIMALRHREFPILGLQFHPESIGTADGMNLIKQAVHSLVE
ncbi:aminodeoxychorismate/anthranilate synthase component II [Jeotgalibacillus sp. ET6]|uniref:anthranilate synthase component II n=1 Tax=Jeotgalibacillus sp. ET6 TaxID=3037260 RepID=UPI0024181D39|nr:aminodeoxychorismate/anthranilate synthase component II [Jeotgalibacillus sp. ET6]MDG5470503.1 aminodeoxychorismate/anthranilate synthase component II [Jeotgalibacillus sp. ET6]